MTSRTPEYLSKTRWYERQHYSSNWAQRNQLMLQLLKIAALDLQQFSFSEYGCGPNRPFMQALTDAGFAGKIHSLDMNQWQDDVITIDLERDDFASLPVADVGVLSGVVEYLYNPEQIFSKLKQKHEYLLLSYRLFQYDPVGSLSKYTEVIQSRANNGWKTHLQLAGLLSVIDNFGFILAAETWRNQTLLLLKKH